MELGETPVVSEICVKDKAVATIAAGVSEPLGTREDGIHEQDTNAKEIRLKIIHTEYFFIYNKLPLQFLILPQFHRLIFAERSIKTVV